MENLLEFQEEMLLVIKMALQMERLLVLLMVDLLVLWMVRLKELQKGML